MQPVYCRNEFCASDVPSALWMLYFHWQALSRVGSLPALQEIDFAALCDGTHSVIITEVIRGPGGEIEDFEIIFADPDIRAASGSEMIGRRLGTLPGKGPGSGIWWIYTMMAMRDAPMFVAQPFEGANRSYRSTREILLPLGRRTGQGEVGYILADIFLSNAPAPSPVSAPGAAMPR